MNSEKYLAQAWKTYTYMEVSFGLEPSLSDNISRLIKVTWYTSFEPAILFD